MVYRTGLIRDVPGSNQLVYEVEVTDRAGIREFVFVHAHAGKILNRYSAVDDALFRRLFEQNTAKQVGQEGDPFPGSLNQNQQNIVSSPTRSAATPTTPRAPRCGRSTTTRGSTARTRTGTGSRPTAATASRPTTSSRRVGSRVRGVHARPDLPVAAGSPERVLLGHLGRDDRHAEGAGTDTPAGVRSDGACSSHTTPVPILVINSPASIAGDCAAAGAAFGPALDATGVTDDVVLTDDGAGVTSDGCEPLVNGADVGGSIALVDRGTCASRSRSRTRRTRARSPWWWPRIVGPPSPMGGTDATITVPSVMVSLSHGDLIKGELPGVNVTMRVGGGTTEDSYRWLMGEDATAFGSAIHDLWRPTCLSDPGKVTDAEYHCATSDQGGVHTNSGVPNHGYGRRARI